MRLKEVLESEILRFPKSFSELGYPRYANCVTLSKR